MSKSALELAREAAAARRPAATSSPAAGPGEPAEFTRVSDIASLGRLIRAARKRRGMSQQSFADLAGVGRRFLSELENGKPTLEIAKVLAVAAASGIDIYARARQ